MGYILLVDDDKWYAESVANMLNKYEIITVESPEEAIRQIDKNIPYMIYLDINLGVKSGTTLLNELQSYPDTRQIPVVILSADGKRLDQKDWEKYNVVQILDKAEITPADLMSIVPGLTRNLAKGKFNNDWTPDQVRGDAQEVG